MKPYKVQFYIYATSEDEVIELEKTMYDFVDSHYKKGVFVTARRVVEALRQFGSNLFVTNFLKK